MQAFCARRAGRSARRWPFALVALLLAAHAASLLAAPGDLDSGGFNAANPIVSDRGKALAKPGRSSAAPDNARGVAVQADGKVLVAGSCSGLSTSKLCVVRYHPDGTPDLTFNPNATQGGLQPDLQAGELIIEETPGQSLFGMVAVQPDQKIIVAGTCSNLTSGYYDFCVVRLLPDSSLDTSFNAAGTTPGVATVAPGAFYNMASSLMLQTDGKIVIVGSCGASLVANAMCLSRHNSDGTLDTSGFNATAPVTQDRGKLMFAFDSDFDGAYAVFVQPDGKLLLGGRCRAGSVAGTGVFCGARLLADGSLDSTWGSGGKAIQPSIANERDLTYAAALQTNGYLLLAGNCYRGSPDAFCVARLEGGPYTPPACTLNIDGNMAVDAATDGLLIVRYLLGLRGAALTGSAVGSNPTRNTAQIEGHLAGLLLAGTLDADNDGQMLATTDGLLILRALLGLSDTALTAGAANSAHPNARNAQQILAWIAATHGAACLP